MPLMNGRGCTANAALRISSAFVGAWGCLTRKAGRFAVISAQQGAVCLKLNMPDVRLGLRGVSFDGDFYAAAFALERGFAGLFYDGNVGRRAFYGKLDWIGFAFATAVAIIQPFAAVGEFAGSLHIGKMRSFDFVIVHGCRMCAKSRRVRHRRHFMRRI